MLFADVSVCATPDPTLRSGPAGIQSAIFNPLSQKQVAEITSEVSQRNKAAMEAYDIDSIVIEDDPDLVQKKKTGFLGRLIGTKPENIQKESTPIASASGSAAASIHDNQPPRLEGWLEKKSRGPLITYSLRIATLFRVCRNCCCVL